jgi:hypothetical protein
MRNSARSRAHTGLRRIKEDALRDLLIVRTWGAAVLRPYRRPKRAA